MKSLKHIKQDNQEDSSHENKDFGLQMTFVFSSQNRKVQSGGEIDVLRGLSFCRVGFWWKCTRKVGMALAILERIGVPGFWTDTHFVEHPGGHFSKCNQNMPHPPPLRNWEADFFCSLSKTPLSTNCTNFLRNPSLKLKLLIVDGRNPAPIDK